MRGAGSVARYRPLRLAPDSVGLRLGVVLPGPHRELVPGRRGVQELGVPQVQGGVRPGLPGEGTGYNDDGKDMLLNFIGVKFEMSVEESELILLILD